MLQIGPLFGLQLAFNLVCVKQLHIQREEISVNNSDWELFYGLKHFSYNV
jgi:hypothetical protein